MGAPPLLDGVPPTPPPRSAIAKKRYWLLATVSVLAASAYSYRGWVAELLAREEARASASIKGGSRASRTALVWGSSWWSKDAGGGSGGAGGSSGASDGGLSECAEVGLSRSEYSAPLVEDLLNSATISAPGTWPHGAWHSVINEACPKFIAPSQNGGAGIGHRLVAYTMALHTAMWFNLTFVHTSLDGGGSSHGNYDGWDAWLAFTKGEWGFDDILKRPGLKRVGLSDLGGYYLGNEAIIAKWRGVLLDPSLCNVMFDMPRDQWAYDVTTHTKMVMSHKFSRAMRDHAAAAAASAASALVPSGGAPPPPSASNKNPLLPRVPPLVYDTGAVHIACHVRVGDQYPTAEWVEARIVSDTILPAIGASGLRAPVHVHVFAEKSGEESFPALAALKRAAGAVLGGGGGRSGGGARMNATSGGSSSSSIGGGGEVSFGSGTLLGGVRVFFYPDMPPLDTFYHLTQADFLVMSFSSFSWAAAQVALRPLSLSQPSSDIFRMCADSAVCCHGCVAGNCEARSGDCTLTAKYRALLTARRLAKLERCGTLAKGLLSSA